MSNEYDPEIPRPGEVPEVTQVPVTPETPGAEEEVPIAVIEGALDELRREEEDEGPDEGDARPPTIH